MSINTNVDVICVLNTICEFVRVLHAVSLSPKYSVRAVEHSSRFYAIVVIDASCVLIRNWLENQSYCE